MKKLPEDGAPKGGHPLTLVEPQGKEGQEAPQLRYLPHKKLARALAPHYPARPKGQAAGHPLPLVEPQGSKGQAQYKGHIRHE